MDIGQEMQYFVCDSKKDFFRVVLGSQQRQTPAPSPHSLQRAGTWLTTDEPTWTHRGHRSPPFLVGFEVGAGPCAVT